MLMQIPAVIRHMRPVRHPEFVLMLTTMLEDDMWLQLNKGECITIPWVLLIRPLGRSVTCCVRHGHR